MIGHIKESFVVENFTYTWTWSLNIYEYEEFHLQSINMDFTERDFNPLKTIWFCYNMQFP